MLCNSPLYKAGVIQYYIFYKEDKTYATILFCTLPYRDQNEDGAEVKAYAHGFSDVYMLEGKGFQPHEDIKMISQSGTEKVEFKFQADEKGGFFSLCLPEVIGEDGGMAHLILKRKTCSLNIKYPWGKERMKQDQSVNEMHTIVVHIGSKME